MAHGELGDSSRIIVADVYGKKPDGGAINGILVLNDGKRLVMVLHAEKIIKSGNVDIAQNQQATFLEDFTDLEREEDGEEIIQREEPYGK
ncbi:hypothetical protein [Lutispora thermophila]|uniref:Uncharacterized protein n=1 Tax=Lutispora thermophila DSM 19022 TaxID=1122184 RepID=A0A1M6EJD4_9FIRM|nr:hypothetical protein [Lutispora thermophila]SHI85541.1 hypothetical protein SAMN02745176_01594 [Lutispora thermophila DSM 19022]